MDITIVISNSEVKQDVSIKPSESFNPNLRKIYEKTKNARSQAELKGLCETLPLKSLYGLMINIIGLQESKDSSCAYHIY